MLTRNIECCACETEGEIEIVGVASRVRPGLRFRYLGYHEFTGDMYFRCPSCKRDVIVNPMEALGPGKIKGIPMLEEAGRKGRMDSPWVSQAFSTR